MIRFFADKRKETTTLILHIGLGIVVSIVPSFLIVWICLLVILTLLDFFQKYNKDGVIHLFLGYYLGMEILTRIAKSSPFIPYESGKYFMTVFLIFGILSLKNYKSSSFIGWLILLLLIPSFLILPFSITYKDIVFNSFGIINLALAVIYFSSSVFNGHQVLSLLRIVVIGLIPVLVSVIFKTPDFEDVKFTLAANFDTSAGFGSNQVSTVLSLGFLILGFSLLLKLPLFRSRWISIVLVSLFFFRALLTFSRGGIVASVIVLFFVWFYTYIFASHLLPRGLSLFRVVIVIGALMGIFYGTNQITKNNLLLRYQGETQSTLSGKREKDISLLTSNRYDIVMSDIFIWKNNLIFGVGPGMSKYSRQDNSDMIAAHIEGSRLLAEHGLFGFAICIILFFYPVYAVIINRMPFIRLFQICMFGYALFTTFHSAMRTNVTPFLFGMAMLSLLYEQKPDKKKKTDSVHWQSAATPRV
jgi:hypothetical protein